MLDKLLSNFQNPMDDFTKTQELIAIDSYFQRLTNYRRLGNKRDKRLEQVIAGYNKTFALVGRFNKEKGLAP
jgi:hypothetical protein